jgi:hypothetical protein
MWRARWRWQAAGPGKRIVTILCDTGFRYLSTLYNAEWLAAKGLTVFPWLMHKEPAVGPIVEALA